MPGMNSRDVTPLRGTAISIIAILVLILHLAGADLFGRSQVHAAVAAPDNEAMCPVDQTQRAPSLPFD